MSAKTIVSKREKEKKVIQYMIRYYCHKKHHQKEPCKACQELISYAYERIDVCPFMETKSFCSNCKVHCYQKEKREQIRNVMRYSGPRMLFHKPVMVIAHLYYSRKETS